MKNKFFGLAFIVAIVVLTTININLTMSEKGDFNLEMANKEALANEENGIHDPNYGSEWFTQGATKDEREVRENCPNQQSSGSGVCLQYDGFGACIEWSNSQSGTSGRTDIRCPYGWVNCTEMDC